jgi:GLPGLI family protein
MGYYFEAWYAEEIPVNAGPEKFDGLPGLILYVKSGNNEYVADYVKFLDKPIEIKMPEFPSDTFTFQEVFSGATKPSKK